MMMNVSSTIPCDIHDDTPSPPVQWHMTKTPCKIAAFVLQLYKIVESHEVGALAWTRNGMAFEIQNIDELTQNVIGRCFRHRKYSSFQRQLNNFGFRKWTKSKAIVDTYSHPMFLRGRFDLLPSVRRGGARTMPKLAAQLNHMQAMEAQTSISPSPVLLQRTHSLTRLMTPSVLLRTQSWTPPRPPQPKKEDLKPPTVSTSMWNLALDTLAELDESLL